MITGAHFLIYSTNPDADRAFLRDVLEFPSVSLGHGWLIFGLPPAELAVHPAERAVTVPEGPRTMAGAVLYLMCDDVKTMVGKLKARGVECREIEQANWGAFTSFRLPSSVEVGLYQPSHPTAIGLTSS